jgi:hypothetical protein
MNDANPYATSMAFDHEAVVNKQPSTKRLWIAFGIAPLTAPVFAAITVFIMAYAYQATHPDKVEVNPMSLVLAPLFLLIVGTPASYGMAGLLGISINPKTNWIGA